MQVLGYTRAYLGLSIGAHIAYGNHSCAYAQEMQL